MSEVIGLKDVVKTEGGRCVVNGVSLAIEEKERVLIYGAPGSGKAALMRLMAAMDRPNGGEITVLDKAVHGMDERAAAAFRNRHIGVVRPENAFMEQLNILDNVALPLTARGVPRIKRNRAAMEQLKALGVPHIAHALPSQLSPFEARLASVARALAAQPKILLIYDLAANLPQREAERLAGMLHAICQYGDFTVVGFEAEKTGTMCADRTMLIIHGTIQEDIS